jgi:hypothetical protein
MSESIVNKVAESGLITLDLETLYPSEEVSSFDLKEHLFMGLILKEKDFRTALLQLDWTAYKDKYVAIYCSADAIIPLWAFMLVTSYLKPVAREIYSGSPEEFKKQLFIRNIRSLETEPFNGARVVVKGCGDIELGEYAYVEITSLLQPHVKSIMYGEPCSTVPVFKLKS